MTSTIMAATPREREAEIHLGRLGVCRLIPKLWEVAMFEADLQHWGKRDIARRYLQLLRDYSNGSHVDTGPMDDGG